MKNLILILSSIILLNVSCTKTITKYVFVSDYVLPQKQTKIPELKKHALNPNKHLAQSDNVNELSKSIIKYEEAVKIRDEVIAAYEKQIDIIAAEIKRIRAAVEKARKENQEPDIHKRSTETEE